jgi:hypothetical protein
MNSIATKPDQWILIGLCGLLLFFHSACTAENNELQLQTKVQAAEQTLLAAKDTTADHKADFPIFWRSFRMDILKKDFTNIARMTRFPFAVRGVSDSYQTKHFLREDFAKVMEQVLNQTVLDIDDQGNLSEKTLFEVVKLMEKPETLPAADQKHIQIKQFEFEMVKNKWIFVQAYLE